MKTIILAAGQGKRMRSSLQKVLHPICGKTILQYVVEVAVSAGAEEITVVVGSDGGEIKNELAKIFGQRLNFAVQEKPLGTGHAVQAGIEGIEPGDDVLILYGDMPLVTADFIEEMKDYRRDNPCDAVVSAAYFPGTSDFGRVYADEKGFFDEIVEARDIKPDSTHTDWTNIGIYLFKGAALLDGLGKMTNDNSQNEYYLTDVPKIVKDEGGTVRVFQTRENIATFTGINTQAHLAEAASYMRSRINARHMENGVRMLDPSAVYVDDDVEIAQGVVIYPGAILEGKCKIETGAVIGPGAHMRDTYVGANAYVRQSVTMGASIGAGTEVGPFAYLRPGTVIGEGCRIGNFVEVKNSNLGDGVKMAHLAYIGDADVGRGVNYSCGAITANYDGKNKFRTTIRDGAFICSNSNLVAPVEIGEGAFVAAGSTITDNLPGAALGVARARQYTKLDWSKPAKL